MATPKLSDSELLAYMRSHTLAVVSTLGPGGAPQAALVGIAVTDDFQIVFDTVATSRKHANLGANPRAAMTLTGPGEQTLQYEGLAAAVSITAPADARWREAYYAAWPDGRDRLAWPALVYWRLRPLWLRYSDFARGPLIVERRFEAG
jgi:pyridoxine/pyridoxamine 5'-phosphate oxidase